MPKICKSHYDDFEREECEDNCSDTNEDRLKGILLKNINTKGKSKQK